MMKRQWSGRTYYLKMKWIAPCKTGMELRILSCEKIVKQTDLERRYWDENKFKLVSYAGQVHKGVRGVVVESVSGGPVIEIDGIDKNVTSFVDGNYMW